MFCDSKQRRLCDTGKSYSFYVVPIVKKILTVCAFLICDFIFAIRYIDVKGVECVINYDFPNNVEDYVHRIGRTGRAGAKGMSYTFFTHSNGKSARDLIQLMRDAEQEVPPSLEALSRNSMPGGGGSRYRSGGGFRRGGGGGGRRW